MSLINREVLLSFEKMDADLCATCGEHHTAEDVIMMIKTAPTVDAVEVVMCKDCKYYCQDKINGVICRHPALDFDTECFDHWINTNPDDFCSYGEKRRDKDGTT